eukprot:5996228-Pyramimonas_sp.AAC.1
MVRSEYLCCFGRLSRTPGVHLSITRSRFGHNVLGLLGWAAVIRHCGTRPAALRGGRRMRSRSRSHGCCAARATTSDWKTDYAARPGCRICTPPGARTPRRSACAASH